MRNKMQHVDFHSVDEFLEYLPDDEHTIVTHLRNLVFECIPGVKEKLNYNVPFFSKHKNICFIWPASILWGNKKSYSGVRFGFTNGYLLNDQGFLDKGNRKQVYYKDFHGINMPDLEILKAYIFEAALIDSALAKKKA